MIATLQLESLATVCGNLPKQAARVLARLGGQRGPDGGRHGGQVHRAGSLHPIGRNSISNAMGRGGKSHFA